MSIRTTQPSNTNKYYLKTTAGGYNKCILGNQKNKYNPRPVAGSCLPNCVGYVYGRFLEYWGLKEAKLPTCNAKDFDNKAKEKNDDIDYSKVPSVGSIIVFEGTECGHVAFVERIEDNGDLFLSESNWGHQIFRNVTVKKKNNYDYSASLKCVGFVVYAKAPKPEPKPEPKPTATNYVVTATVLNVRATPSIKGRIKTYAELTADAQKKIKAITGTRTNGYVKGMRFTAYETVQADGYTWGKTPSGWVALEHCQKEK